MVTISRIAAMLLLGIVTAHNTAAQEAERKEVDIPAKANIYYNYRTKPLDYLEGGIGIEPILIDVRGIKMITFENTTGTVNLLPADSISRVGNADGIKGVTALSASKGMSGLRHDRKYGFLAGVFVSNSVTPEETVESIDFTNRAEYTTWGFQLEQAFFIGDGVTDKNEQQVLLVPTDADRLYLGFADGGLGDARGYDDNVGSIHTTVVLHKTLMSSAAKPVAAPPATKQVTKKK